MISLLVVNYHSAQLAIDAIRTARAASREPLQAVVVDNSLDDAEAAALRGHADALIVSDRNRGYAGGINLGRKECEGSTLIVSNPDVRFAPGAIDTLVERLDRRAAVAGPAFYWDDAHHWILPPADLVTAWEKLDEVLASRSRKWMEQRDRRRFLARVRFWSLIEPVETRALSGAVLAMRAAAFDEVRGFDERFPLYFEENDFLRRVAARGKRIEYVPAARCRHLYNQSAGLVATEAGARYAQSQRAYLEKWNGPAVARVLERIEKPPRVADATPIDGPIDVDRDDVVVEVSPLPTFATAAGHFPVSRSVELPPEVLDSFRGGALYLRVVQRDTGAVLATYARRRMGGS